MVWIAGARASPPEAAYPVGLAVMEEVPVIAPPAGAGRAMSESSVGLQVVVDETYIKLI
jgi:hypothetical protein